MKTFFHFNNGFEIADSTINSWIQKCLAEIKKGADKWAISSGDTSVIGLAWKNRDGSISEIEILVCNKAGKSKLRFGYDDAIEYEDYVRPVLTEA